jgi:hypothetical protein
MSNGSFVHSIYVFCFQGLYPVWPLLYKLVPYRIKIPLYILYTALLWGGGGELRRAPNVPTSNTIENPEFTYAHIIHYKAHAIYNIQLWVSLLFSMKSDTYMPPFLKVTSKDS